MKRKYTGMTLIELLLVASIIVILGGLLIPAISMVRRTASETRQRAELNTIELAITTFKNDYGDYPPSSYDSRLEDSQDYSGAQKLAEALCGWDLLGFHPDSHWRSDGEDGSGSPVYDPNTTDLTTLKVRKGPYLDMSAVNVFRVGDQSGKPGLFKTYSPLAPETYVICDVFGVRSLQSGGKRVLAGTPILYYKANPASRDHDNTGQYPDRIYNVLDNDDLVQLDPLTPSGAASTTKTHPIGDTGSSYAKFYEFIRDRRALIHWPYKPDSYILISAGADGEYGTKDDICNFPTP